MAERSSAPDRAIQASRSTAEEGSGLMALVSPTPPPRHPDWPSCAGGSRKRCHSPCAPGGRAGAALEVEGSLGTRWVTVKGIPRCLGVIPIRRAPPQPLRGAKEGLPVASEFVL